MKATLEFQLPEEREEHIRAVHAADAWATLDDIDQELRRILKYGSEITRDQLAEAIRSQINELCQRITS
jgi:DNA-binding IclR family transcriptional regulator